MKGEAGTLLDPFPLEFEWEEGEKLTAGKGTRRGGGDISRLTRA